MNPSSNDLRQPYERVFDQQKIEEVTQLAVRRALRRHRLLGNPIAVWQDDAVVWIQPADIPVDVDDPTLRDP